MPHTDTSNTSPIATIQPTELSERLADPDLRIVDARPLAAYNGWRLRGEARGGHIPGAAALPSEWLRPPERRRPARPGRQARPRPWRRRRSSTATTQTTPGRSPSRSRPSGVDRAQRCSSTAGRRGPPTRPGRSSTCPDSGSSSTRRGSATSSTAAARRRRQPDASSSSTSTSASPRSTPRRTFPARVVPRHELAREPGRLEPAHARGARASPRRARHQPRRDGRPVRPRHRG